MDENPYQNPYQPPSPTQADDVTKAKMLEVGPPRYRGAPALIQGDLDEATAIELASRCKPIEVDSPTDKPQNRTRLSTIILLVAICAGLLFLFFLPGRRLRSGTAPAPATPAAGFDWSLVFFVFIPIGILAALFFLFRLLRVRYDKSDPPLGGNIRMAINELGCSIEKSTRDDRLIEVFCSWRQIQITHCDEAWLLNVGMVNPFLIAKSFLDSPEKQACFESLATDVTRWQATQTPLLNMDSIPDEASESFPDFRRDATVISISSRTERRARRAVASKIRKELPEYRSSVPFWPGIIWKFLIAAVAAILVYVLASLDWTRLESQWGVLLGQLLPLAALLIVGLWLGFAAAKEIKVDGAISDHSIWYDYRSLLLRLPLSTLPFRKVVAGNLVLATATGSTTVVLHPSHFESHSSFERVANALIT